MPYRTNTSARLGAQQTERALARTSTSARVGAAQVERALDRTNTSARQGALQTKRALDRTSTSARLGSLRVERALARTNTSARLGALQVERAFKRTELASRQVERSLDRVGDRAARVRRLIGRTFALVGVGAAIHQIAQLSDSFIDLQNRARIAADSIGGDLGGTLDAVTAVAVRTRAPVLALAGVFQRGSIAAKELNATQEELIRLAEIAGKSVAIQGGGLDTARGALLQLSQTLGQTIVRGEEFNSILEGAFPIALAAARGIERVGGSVGRLRTEIIEGRVTSEEFFRGILAGGEEIDRQFALTTPTIGQAFTVLRTGLIRSSEALNEIAAPLAGFIRDVGLAVTVLAGVERQQIITEDQTERIEAITTAFQVLRVTVISLALVLAARLVRSLAVSANGIDCGAARGLPFANSACPDGRHCPYHGDGNAAGGTGNHDARSVDVFARRSCRHRNPGSLRDL